jgi:hypothetical protein
LGWKQSQPGEKKTWVDFSNEREQKNNVTWATYRVHTI